MKLSYKINAAFITLALCAAVLIAITSLTSRALLVRSLGAQNIFLGDQILHELYERVFSMGEELRFVLGKTPDPVSMDAKTRAAELVGDYRVRYGYQVLEEVLLSDSAGEVLWTTLDAPPENYSAGFSSAGKGGEAFLLGSLYFDELLDTPVLPLGITVTDGDRGDLFLWAKVSGLDLFRNIEVQYAMRQPIQSKLITPEGKMVYATGVFHFLEDMTEEDYYKRLLGGSGFFQMKERGRNKIYGYSKVEKHRSMEVPGWYIMVGYDVEQILAQNSAVTAVLHGVGFVLVVLSLLLGIILSRKIIRPVRDLMEGTKRVGAGDLDTLIKVTAGDEIGELAEDFNQMILKLKKSYTSLEKEIRAREKTETRLKESITVMHRVNRDLTQFAYAASHDLQEPLRSIAGFLQLIERRYKNVLDEKGVSYIRRSVEAAERLQLIINDLLYYSGISLAFENISRCDLNSVVERVVNGRSELISSSRAAIEKDELPAIYADEKHMESLFDQLISNALIYRREGVPPVIRLRVMGADKEFFTLAVSDNGTGIEEKYHEKIFDMFQRLHQRMRHGGNGIGLAICKKIVEIYGGTIQVESKPGEGSSFIFSLHNIMEE